MTRIEAAVEWRRRLMRTVGPVDPFDLGSSPSALMRRLVALTQSPAYVAASARRRRRMRYRVCIAYHARCRERGEAAYATWVECIRELTRWSP